VVPAYNINPKLSFSKTLLKKQQFEKKVLFQMKDVLDFKNIHSKTLPCSIKSFQNSRLCEINYCLGVKTAFEEKKWNIEKSCPIQNFWPLSNVLKTLPIT
jgi:hypothetical protein